MTRQSILIISDYHAPYNHPDAYKFLVACKAKFKPTEVISVGDETDYHALSFHDSDPDLPSAGDELKLAITQLKPLYALFPKVTIMDSNHGSMVYRKAFSNGIPRVMLKGYNDVLEAPRGWKWVPEYRISTPLGDVLFRHSFQKNILKAALENGCSVVSGHYHEDFSLSYAGNSYKLLYGMTVGCLIDNDSMAFAYNKLFAKKPVIGVAVIIDGLPQLVPMVLNKKGRWIGSV